MIMARIEAICLSNRGLRRPCNEDNYLFCEMVRKEDPESTSIQMYSPRLKSNQLIVGVFDGMGGMAHGERASLTAASCFLNHKITAKLHETFPELCRRANGLIQDQNEEAKDESGTTVAAIGFESRKAVVCNVGDSRVYRKCGGNLEQLSKDHTDKALLESMGITARQPRLMQYLGMSNRLDVHPAIIAAPLKKGDIYLCCTDGLYSMVPDSELSALLNELEPLQTIANNLMDAALKAGGRDNITFVVCKVRFGL